MRPRHILLAAAAFLAATLIAGADNLLRCSYKSNGYTHIRTERSLVGRGGDCPFWLSIGYVIFPDGVSDAYILGLDFEGGKPFIIPKGTGLSATLTGGGTVNASQMSASEAASSPFTNADGKKVYWSRGRYLFEAPDFRKLLSGVKAIDVTTGWNPDDYIQAQFKGDEFSATLKELYAAIEDAPRPTEELGDNMAGISDNSGSIMAVTKRVRIAEAQTVEGVGMEYIYYKATNAEDYDLFLTLTGGDRLIPLGTEVAFNLTDGGEIVLRQQRDAYDELLLYPSAEEVKAIASGLASIDIRTEGRSYAESVNAEAIARAIAKLYNSLQEVAVL